MPIYQNDFKNKIIKRVVTCTSIHAPSMVVQYFDGSEKIFEGNMVPLFIKKYTNSNNKNDSRIIGYELEEQLRHDFNFLFADTANVA